MSFPPFDSSAPSHAPSPRNAYPQPVYGSYDQHSYGHMGYGDMPQSDQRYHSQVPLQYPSEAAGAPSGSGQYDSYGGPSFSPTSAQFAADAYGTLPNSDAMTYAPRRRHQSASAVNLPSESRYPTSRRSSGEGHMPAVQEGYEFVPSQVPSQPYYDPNAPSSRHAAVRPSTGSSSTASALALEKPYVCDICQTRFARHHDCRRHRETHVVNASGEKPHHCVVCGKSFTRKDALKRHTNQKGCDINAAVANNNLSSRSSRSSSSSSPQQVAGTFYPVGNLPHGSGNYY